MIDLNPPRSTRDKTGQGYSPVIKLEWITQCLCMCCQLRWYRENAIRPYLFRMNGIIFFWKGMGIAMLKNKNICILGAGSMGEAMIAGLLKNKLIPANQIYALGRKQLRLYDLANQYGVLIPSSKDAIENAHIIIIAVKPKDIEVAIHEIRPYTRDRQLFISVVAGISTNQITDLLGYEAAIVRTMPNTSAKIGLSATGLAPGAFVSEQQLQLSMAIFASIGTVEIVSEDALHAVTGLSGSGPAYVYYLVQAMQDAAEEVGLDSDVARSLILQTIIGSAHMLLETAEDPAMLRKQVTSPNGTTAAGIAMLEQYNFSEAISRCISRATERSREMGSAYLTE